MAHGDDIAAPDEHAGLAHREFFADPLERLHGDEQGLAIDLQLGPLVGLVGVLDRQLMELELALQLGQQFLAGLVQADPDHPPGLDLHVLRVVDIQIPDLEAALVDGAIDDWTHLWHSRSPRDVRTQANVFRSRPSLNASHDRKQARDRHGNDKCFARSLRGGQAGSRLLHGGHDVRMGPPRAGHLDDCHDTRHRIAGNRGIREKAVEVFPVIETAPRLVDECQPVCRPAPAAEAVHSSALRSHRSTRAVGTP